MSRTDHALYALRDGRGVHISEVEQGLGCRCFCGVCGGKLVATKGWKNAHHFRHLSLQGCTGGKGGPETALHRRAIEILAQMTSLQLPGYELPLPAPLRDASQNRSLGFVVEAQRVQIRGARMEPRLRGICPDAMVWDANGTPLMLEVVVTHDVDDAKLAKIRQIGYATLALVLPREDEAYAPAQLEEKLRDELEGKRWVFHPKEEQARQRIQRALDDLPPVPAADPNGKLKVTQTPKPLPAPCTLEQSTEAMQAALITAEGKLSAKNLAAYQQSYWRNFGRWPTASDFRVHAKLQGVDIPMSEEERAEREASDRQIASWGPMERSWAARGRR